MSLRLVVFTILVTATIGSAIGVVYTRHEHRQFFIESSRLERERDELNIEFGRLQLEQATWAETSRVEQFAGEKLGMKFPESADIVVMKP